MGAKLYDFICEKCQIKEEHWHDIESKESVLCKTCNDGTIMQRCFPSPDFRMPWTGSRGITKNGTKFETVGEPRRYNPQTGEFKEKVK